MHKLHTQWVLYAWDHSLSMKVWLLRPEVVCLSFSWWIITARDRSCVCVCFFKGRAVSLKSLFKKRDFFSIFWGGGGGGEGFFFFFFLILNIYLSKLCSSFRARDQLHRI